MKAIGASVPSSFGWYDVYRGNSRHMNHTVKRWTNRLVRRSLKQQLRSSIDEALAELRENRAYERAIADAAARAEMLANARSSAQVYDFAAFQKLKSSNAAVRCVPVVIKHRRPAPHLRQDVEQRLLAA